jgi:hypothetical protein
VSGLVSNEYGEEAPAPTPSAENGVVRKWRHEGREKKAGWWTRWWQSRRWPSLSCGGIDFQMGRVWRTGPRHNPFNSAWANLARVSCGAWVVALARSAGPTRLFFYFTKNHIYICTIYIQYYKHLSMMFYWLDSFAQCLPPHPSSIRVWVQTPPPALFFNILLWFNQISRRAGP